MKEQSTFVFNTLPEYTGEEGYVEPRAEIEKQIKESNNTPRDQYVSMDQMIANYENQCSEVDYTKLRPGVKVKIKSWKRMVNEYGVDDQGDINKVDKQDVFVIDMEKYCETVMEISYVFDDDCHMKEANRGFYFPFSCIEQIIEPQEEPREQKHPYATPKRVKALWLGQTEGEVSLEYFEQMHGDYIGLKAGGRRYILQTSGDSNGFATRGNGTYTTKTQQKSLNAVYLKFNSARDLYLWMAEGEE